MRKSKLRWSPLAGAVICFHPQRPSAWTRGLETGAERCKAVSVAGVDTGRVDALDEVQLLHLSEAFGEQVRGDAWQAAKQIGVSERAEEEVANDEQGPAFARRASSALANSTELFV